MNQAIVIDCETTGLSPKDCRVTEIAVVSFESGEVLLRTYLDPECHIPEKITELTGISNATVLHAPKFRDVAPALHELISHADAVLGWNPSFDRGMIDAEFERLGDLLTPPRWPILVDGKRIWDVFEPRELRHLMNGYKRFVDRAGFEGAHGALADTRAARDVIRAQIDLFGLRGKPWEEMDPERKLWFGSTPHILWVPNDYAISGIPGDKRLVVNFGKHRGTPVVDVDVGFWRWITEREFPEHVLMLSIKVLDHANKPRVDFVDAMDTWARAYSAEKFA